MENTGMRKVLFKELIPLPHRECQATKRKKVFESHLLSSPENQKIIHAANRTAQRKEELAEAKSAAYKRFLEEEKEKKKKLIKKKKITVRADSIKGQSLPAAVRGRGRGCGRGHGRVGAYRCTQIII